MGVEKGCIGIACMAIAIEGRGEDYSDRGGGQGRGLGGRRESISIPMESTQLHPEN